MGVYGWGPIAPLVILKAGYPVRCGLSILFRSESAYAAGTGNAVTDLIFSIAKREVTFFSGTALISFL